MPKNTRMISIPHSYGLPGSLPLNSVSVRTESGLGWMETFLYRAQYHENSEQKGHLYMNFLHFSEETIMEGKRLAHGHR